MKITKTIPKPLNIICLLLLCTAQFFLTALPAHAGISKDTFSVAFIDYDKFVTKETDGTYSGFLPDYLSKISEYTGWNYEYIQTDWPDAYKRVRSGEIDFYFVARQTKERINDFDFSSFPICNEPMNLYVSSKSRLIFSDFQDDKPEKIGMLVNSIEKKQFELYAEKNHFKVQIIGFESNNDAITALIENKIDAAAVVELSVAKPLTIIANFGIAPAYAASCRGSKKMQEFNAAQEQLTILQDDFAETLFTKYFQQNKTVSWTQEEKNFIKNNGIIKVAFIPDRAPYSYTDKNGNPTGITKDIMDLIAERTGFSFEYCFMPGGMKVPDFLKDHPDYFISGASVENQLFKSLDYIVSNVFYQDDIALAAKKNTDFFISAPPKTYTLAISTSYTTLQSVIKEKFPIFNIILCKNTEESLKLVKTGKADFIAQNVNILRPFTQNPRYENISILPTFFLNENAGIVCRGSPENRQITGIFNKAIATITVKEKNQFTINHTLINGYKLTAGDFIYKFRYPLFVILILFILLFSSLAIWNTNKKKNLLLLKKINLKLSNANKAAEKASEAKSQFLAQMSHEIRTPMNAIIGLTQIAADEIDKPEKMKDYLGKIDGSSRLLLSIINDVLDMSAIERGKLKIDSRPFNLKNKISTLISIFYQQAKQKNVDFDVHINNLTEESVSGDELRVNQILMNLLSNAVKFTSSSGKIVMTITQTSCSQNTVQIQFEVADTGCGMSKDMQKRLFKPFEQESASTARKHGGSGLGLSITKNLVEMMNGSIQVKSELNKGSVFTVDLPFATCEQAFTIDTEKFKSIKVLVVDDDVDSLKYCKMIFDRFGVDFTSATSGERALEVIGEAEDQKRPFKLCIIDWKMPNMDGISLSKKIRKIFGVAPVIIIVSAYDLNEVEPQGKEAGINYFITKPLFQSTIYNVLMEIIGTPAKVIKTQSESDKYDFKGKRVLIAEDVALNMEVAIKLLQMAGVEPVCAEDGQQAVDIYSKSAEKPFDCILLDINMPVMDGYEAAKIIRSSALPDAKTIPIYAMTANVFSTDITDALNAGMNGHIAKPIETAVLYKTLNEAFKKSST